jgi:hydroxylamine dehydrogenase
MPLVFPLRLHRTGYRVWASHRRLSGEQAETPDGNRPARGGCVKCHSIGRPNVDGTIGNCTACHTRHTASVAIARLPTTCGQCHMGPDHSQVEIYHESKHGVMFSAQKHLLHLDREPAKLTTRDMFIPTCVTCHMSGLNGLKVTHDTTERLSYWLATEVSQKRPNYALAQAAMQEVCAQCHTRPVIDFKYFDLWHYYGRTAKHGAFMGGADFTQWHGNYPLLQSTVEIKAMAEELRRNHARPQ